MAAKATNKKKATPASGTKLPAKAKVIRKRSGTKAKASDVTAAPAPAPASPKAKPPAKTAVGHPPYLQMIAEAISTLRERSGSSQPAIAKFIQEKYEGELPANFKKLLSVQLKKQIKQGNLVKVKSSFKLSDDYKKGHKRTSVPVAAEEEAEETPVPPPSKKAKVSADAKKPVEKPKTPKTKKTAAAGTKQPSGSAVAKAAKAAVKVAKTVRVKAATKSKTASAAAKTSPKSRTTKTKDATKTKKPAGRKTAG